MALELRTTLIFLSVCLIYSCRRLKRKSITNFYLFYLFIFLLFLFSLIFITQSATHQQHHKTYNKRKIIKSHSEETCENATSIIGNIALKSDCSRASQPKSNNKNSIFLNIFSISYCDFVFFLFYFVSSEILFLKRFSNNFPLLFSIYFLRTLFLHTQPTDLRSRILFYFFFSIILFSFSNFQMDFHLNFIHFIIDGNFSL